MLVFSPKTLYDAWPAFYAFVDFLIRMINEDKVKITWTSGSGGLLTSFDIWLSESQNIKEESKICFRYEPYRGYFVGSITPIQRFRFELMGQGILLANLESKDPQSYDKMLELFKAIVAYSERHHQKWHQLILENVDLESLKRSNWKKSRKDIENEFNEKWETRRAAEDFERQRKQELSKLTTAYSFQGYDIID